MSTKINSIDLQILKKKVYEAARDGRAFNIFAMLWNHDRELVVKEVLSNLTEENGQLTTPLIIAARNGEEKVVQVLLSNFDVDIEQTGTVRFDGYAIQGATALWCAAGAGHYNIIKLLLEHGADVNHSTITNSTPLRAACFDGRLDIVRYLLNNGADFMIANKFKNTCLMIASYKGHKHVVEVLLEKGAPPDARAHCGATALHFSAECGHLNIVEVLMNSNASVLTNDKGMTPLLVAAECVQEDVVEYLISLPSCSRIDKINALELLGASFANDKDRYDIVKAFKFLRRGIVERFRDPNDIIWKELGDPVPAYNSRVECRTLGEIEAIKSNHDALHMEGLAIRERILGRENPDVPHPVIFRGAVFADGARFDRCTELWLHAMQLRQDKQRSVSKDLLRFAQVFSQMVHLNIEPEFKLVKEVFVRGTAELIFDDRRKEENPNDLDNLQETYEENIHTLLYLIAIILKLKIPSCEKDDMYSWVYKFLQLKPQLSNGYTTLHMVTDSATIVDDFHVNDIVTFPNGQLCNMLIECGADINAQDLRGNTPLHIIVQYANPISDFENLHLSMISLIRANAHLDICNHDNKTAMDVSTTGVAEVILKTNSSLSLKCVAAQCLRKNSIIYKGLVPKELEAFIEWH